MKLNINNELELADHLAKVNGRATAHTMTAGDVEQVARMVERDLINRGARKKDMPGTVVHYRPPGPGKAYARKARYFTTTEITLQRGASAWFLTRAQKADHWSDAPASLLIEVSTVMHERIVDAATQNLVVHP